MPQKVVPLCRVDLYAHGAEPYFGVGSRQPASWYDPLSTSWQFGAISYDATTLLPELEYLGGEGTGKDRCRRANNDERPIGLVMRPTIVPQDIGAWTDITPVEFAGTWQTFRVAQNPPKLALVQLHTGVTSAGATLAAGSNKWARESPYSHPAGASIAFSVMPLAVSPEYNAATGGASVVYAGWSCCAWSIALLPGGDAYLLKAGTAVMELRQPPKPARSDLPQIIDVLVRVQRGALLVSLDGGASYDAYSEPDGSAVTMAAGTYRFSGNGCSAAYWLHQVTYPASATYDSPILPLDGTRTNFPTLTLKGAQPGGTGGSVALTNLASTTDPTAAQYRATFTPGAQTEHWAYAFSPELYTAEVHYAAVPTAGSAVHDSGATFEGRIFRLDVTEPLELDQASCTFTCRYTQAEGGFSGSYALRLVKVYGGWLYDDGSNDVRLLFTGYLTDPKVVSEDSNEVWVTFQAMSVALRPKTYKWTDYVRPHDGLTVNQSLSRWLADMGLNDTYALFPAAGTLITLPDELPEQPSHMPESGCDRWKMQAEMWARCKYELGVTRGGLYQPVPVDTWNATAFVWRAVPLAPNSDERLASIEYGQRVMETYTGVMARGRSARNERLSAWVIDGYAEQDPANTRFRPWPMRHIETCEHPVTRPWLNRVCQGVAYNKLTPLFETAWRGELATPYRRDSISIVGTKVGAGDPATVGVLTMKHTFDRTSAEGAWTELEGKKL